MILRRNFTLLYTIIISVAAILLLTQSRWLQAGKRIESPYYKKTLDSLYTMYFNKTEETTSVIFYFDPTCEYCKETLTRNRTKIVNANNYNFLFISKADSASSYRELTDQLPIHSFKYVYDKSKELLYNLKIKGFPTVIEYNRIQKKYLIFEGSDKIEYFFKTVK